MNNDPMMLLADMLLRVLVLKALEAAIWAAVVAAVWGGLAVSVLCWWRRLSK